MVPKKMGLYYFVFCNKGYMSQTGVWCQSSIPDCVNILGLAKREESVDNPLQGNLNILGSFLRWRKEGWGHRGG